MKKHHFSAVFPVLLGGIIILSYPATSAEVAMLFKQDLADMPGKAGQLLTVEFAPGEVSAPHRHNAHTFVYVLEGSVVMQVQGGEAKTLTAGQTFYENPDDIHTVANNASDTEPAKILVFFIKDSDAPASMPVE
ncbi:MAG: cupin domain-containing protein [Gammaproteobacteria bacterium]|nr:cupin domain-containing protein [Gammaproteobacteria bacterium]MDE0286212.1 cupin domain-containing protein [Gammaproteobacteria bacterium]MDE0513114.1 cupin domain-containing protein [Gammaproteobacteria bacterium]